METSEEYVTTLNKHVQKALLAARHETSFSVRLSLMRQAFQSVDDLKYIKSSDPCASWELEKIREYIQDNMRSVNEEYFADSDVLQFCHFEQESEANGDLESKSECSFASFAQDRLADWPQLRNLKQKIDELDSSLPKNAFKIRVKRNILPSDDSEAHTRLSREMTKPRGADPIIPRVPKQCGGFVSESRVHHNMGQSLDDRDHDQGPGNKGDWFNQRGFAEGRGFKRERPTDCSRDSNEDSRHRGRQDFPRSWSSQASDSSSRHISSLPSQSSTNWGPINSHPRQQDSSRESGPCTTSRGFMSGTDKLRIEMNERSGGGGGGVVAKKTLGTKRPQNGFTPPWIRKPEQGASDDASQNGRGRATAAANNLDDEEMDERLKNLEPEILTRIQNEIIDRSPGVQWDDIAGLNFAKKSVMEIVVWPMLRPDLFTGLRGPPKGLLLFGPPGTGKTMIGRTIASESHATFFNISASSLMSKWIGEGEKMVRALFVVARVRAPSVIFIDEIDSLLSQRTEGDAEASRRVKTEFLVQMDGVGCSSSDRVLTIGATNRPQELDEAARRRMVKRLYIPMPDGPARLSKRTLVERLLMTQDHSLNEEELEELVAGTQGYSGADLRALCTEAAMGPIRGLTDIRTATAATVRPICADDFRSALRQVRASVSQAEIDGYTEWNNAFGSFPSNTP